MKKLVWIGTVGALVLLGGCVSEEPEAPPEPLVTTAPQMVLEPGDPNGGARLDLGAVLEGSFRDAELRVRNEGDAPLQLRELILSDEGGPGFSLQGQEPTPWLLAPGEETGVVLRYTPERNESRAETLALVTNDPAQGLVMVEVRAEGIAPIVQIDPPAHSFGQPLVGCELERQVAVSNVGRGQLIIEELLFDDLAAHGELSLVEPPELGASLGPGQSMTLQVRYAATDVLPDAGTLTVRSNDPQRPEASASFTATGGALSPPVAEQFVTAGTDVDFLFVVDGVNGILPALQQALAIFVEVLDGQGVDYQIGVVSTDLADNGQLQGTTPIVRPTTPDPGGTVAASLSLVGSYFGPNNAFDSARLALSPPNTGVGGVNFGFRRPDARLRVVFISDRPDTSTGLGGGDPAAYVAFFRSVTWVDSYLEVSDISGGLTGCNTASLSAGPGAGFVAASALTGGLSASICEPSWTGPMTELALSAADGSLAFPLSEVPVPESLAVRLSAGGSGFVELNAGWSLDSDANAVVFDEASAPDEGDLVEFDYSPLGMCGG